MLNWKEAPHFRGNFTEYKKKSLKILQKSCSIKWVPLLPHFCNKFGKICRAKFKVWLLIKISLYTATLLQDLFQNFGLIKFNLVNVSQYKVTLKEL